MIVADRNLLFGILAVQMNFVARDALIAGMNAWVLEQHRALGGILVEQGAMTLARHNLLEQLVNEHVAAHGGDAEKSLGAVDRLGAIRHQLTRHVEPELVGILSRAPSAGGSTDGDPEATLTYEGNTPAPLRSQRHRRPTRTGWRTSSLKMDKVALPGT
jgi:eukaryotic-like serine/threonine-protein kinase